MRETLFIALLLVACGDDEARPGTDASVARQDMAGDDASTTDDGFVAPTDGGGTDARPPDAARAVEDCSTDLDEDGDTHAGCADPDCLDESRCIEADLTDRGLGDWTVCQSLSFDEAATRERCEEGLPAWVESSRELRCDLVPTLVQVDVYCPPEGSTEEVVEVRWRVAMDTTGSDRMLGPSTYESTSYMAELFLSNTVTEFGPGGSSGEALYTTAETWWPDYRAVGWRQLPRGARLVAFTTISVDVSTFHLYDGGVNVSSTGPSYAHNAAFEIPSAGIE
ncbi:MAG: hypothetical protein JJ863_31045 [Deltaproteobacteria bacterium]|nr:hypothetical protein [Deltaproteobacteria bacterium]